MKEISANAWGKQVSACMPTETLNEKHTDIKKTHGERQREDKDLGGGGVQ